MTKIGLFFWFRVYSNRQTLQNAASWLRWYRKAFLRDRVYRGHGSL